MTLSCGNSDNTSCNTFKTKASVAIWKRSRVFRFLCVLAACWILLPCAYLSGQSAKEYTFSGGRLTGVRETCAVALSASSTTVPIQGTTGTVSVTGSPSCAWAAESGVSWITITGAGSGTGPGTVSYTVARNTGWTRTGAITIGHQALMITQGGEACQNECNATYEGCYKSARQQTDQCATQCSRTIIKGGCLPGYSNCNELYASCVSECVGGSSVEACTDYYGQCTASCHNACGYELRQESTGIAAGGGTGGFGISTSGTNCVWMAKSYDSWIKIAVVSGTGDGTIGYTAEANNGPARTGTITAAGKTHRVDQANGCTYEPSRLSPESTIQAGGGSGSVWVNRSDTACSPPTAVSNASAWITAAVNGGDVTYTVAGNTGPYTRTGTITISGNTFTVTQAGCTYGISPADASGIVSGGGSGSFNVNSSGSACVWTAAVASDASSWITVSSGDGDGGSSVSGTGSGSVNYTVKNQTGLSARAGTIGVQGNTFTITQDGCNQSLSSTYNNIGFTGGTGSVAVSSGPGCVWTATVENSASSWITVTGGGSGTGDGSVSYKVDANPGEQRSGTVTIGNKTFTVTQEANCQLGCGSPEQCSDTSSCLDTCMGSTGCYIAVGDCIEAVNTCVYGCSQAIQNACYGQAQQCQAACYNACGYTLSSTGASVPIGGASGTVTVNSAACSWTAGSNVSWITVTGGRSGTGAGTVSYTVAANTGGARTGTMTIAGKTFTVTQAGCTYSITPAGSGTTGINGGSGSFTVTTNGGSCVWTVSNKPSWVSITGGNGGTGTGVVSYTVGSNASGPPRSGTITTGGQTFTVSQDGTNCQQMCMTNRGMCYNQASMCQTQCGAMGTACGGPYYPQCVDLMYSCLSECSNLQSECDYNYSQCMSSCR